MLRKATPEDFEAWKSIYMQASVNPFMVYGSMSELNAAFLDLTQKSTLYVFENEEDKNIVGICRLTPSSGDSKHVIEINSFAISEKYRGKGYANSMLQAIMEEIAKKTEILRVQLGVEGDNPVAQHLYTKAGFELEASYDDWYRRYEGTHKEKWFVSENFMVKLLHVCDIKPLTSTHPITRFVDISKCDLRKATSLDVEKTYNLYQKRQISLGLKVKALEEFSADFIELLSNGTLYIYEAEHDIVSLCHLSPYTQYERLKHNAEIDFIIVDPTCSSEITGSLLESIIKDQKKNGIKRVEMTLLEGDENLIEAF